MARKQSHATWTIPPPAPVITPKIARQWLRRAYPALSGLAGRAHFPNELLYARNRDRVRLGLIWLAHDVYRITNACAEAIDTGRPVPMEFLPEMAQNPRKTQTLRYVVRFEARRPHRGTRGILKRALRERERIAREACRG